MADRPAEGVFSSSIFRYSAALFVGFSLGFLLYAVGPDAHLSSTAQSIAIAGLGLAAAAVGVIVGSTISADAARRASDMERENADHALTAGHREASLDRAQRYELSLFELKVPLIRGVLEEADKAVEQRDRQVETRQEAAAGTLDPDLIAVVSPTAALEKTVEPLLIFAEQKTAEAADRLVTLVIGFNRWEYDAAKHRAGAAVTGLSYDEMKAYGLHELEYLGGRVEFLNAVRAELHKPLLDFGEISTSPTPDAA